MEGANTSQATVDASLVFDGVTVVDVEQGKLIPAQRVVIAGIASGPADRLRGSQHTRIVDARGKYLIPGLWDLHTILWLTSPTRSSSRTA